MKINLIDSLNQNIEIGDIVKRENLISSTMDYFMLKEDEQGLYLFKCNIDRNNGFDEIMDIHIDEGVQIITDGNWRWTRMNPKEKVNIDID